MRTLLAELRRRNVDRAAAVYAAAAWLLVQVAGQLFPLYGIPNQSIRWLIGAAVAGFPLAVALSWFHQWTPRSGAHPAIAPERQVAANARPAAPPPDNAIAVLPFVDLSQDHDHEYFADGLSEELLNLLAQLPQLRVIARTSSFAFKGKDIDVAGIAKALNVATVLEGSVRKAGNTLRVTAQLIRTYDSTHLWSQTFDRELTNVFEVQDQIAGAVVAALKVKLLPGQQFANPNRTSNTQAHDQYLLGQDVLRRGRYDDSRLALAAFQRAIELDPLYGAAYAGLASAQSAVADFAQDPERRAALKMEALETAGRAVALAPELADGYLVRAQLRYRQLWDWRGARADLQRALELEPGSTDVLLQNALMLHNLGHLPEAVEMAQRMTCQDPLSWVAWLIYGFALRNSGQMAEARAALQRSLAINPNSSWTRYALGGLELLEGQAEAALAAFRQAGEPYREAGIAMAQHSLGHAYESATALAEIEAAHAAGFAYQIAEVHAWRGDHDAAFHWLDRACAQRDSGVARIRSEPMLSVLHADPRWAALLQKLNFPD